MVVVNLDILMNCKGIVGRVRKNGTESSLENDTGLKTSFGQSRGCTRTLPGSSALNKSLEGSQLQVFIG